MSFTQFPRLRVWCFALVLSSSACGSNDTSACNSLVDDGPTVTPTSGVLVPPSPMGGSFADGVYELTAMTLYGGTPPADDLSAVFEIAGTTMQQVGRIGSVEKRYTSTFTTSGTTVSTTDTCPAPDSGSHSFTATATSFAIYDSVATGTLEQRYTRR